VARRRSIWGPGARWCPNLDVDQGLQAGSFVVLAAHRVAVEA
jgi:hypothetical protein